MQLACQYGRDVVSVASLTVCALRPVVRSHQLNRVHPEDGRLLSSSYQKRKLQDFAREYEQQRGKVYCEQRVLNHEARKRGESTKYKALDRRMYEEISRHIKITKDSRHAIEQARTEQRKIDAALMQKGRDLTRNQQDDKLALAKEIRTTKEIVQDEYKKRRAKMVSEIREVYKPIWRDQYHRQQQELSDFQTREHQMIGRLHNSLQTVSMVIGISASERPMKLGELFGLVVSREVRLSALTVTHEAEKRQLHRIQRDKERQVSAKVKEACQIKLQEKRAAFVDQVAALSASHAKEKRTLQLEWRERHKERKRSWHDMAEKIRIKTKAKSDFNRAVTGKTPDTEAAKRRIQKKLKGDKEKGRDGR